MLTSEIYILLSTAAAIAFIHTLIGPDHDLVFVALGKARNWLNHCSFSAILLPTVQGVQSCRARLATLSPKTGCAHPSAIGRATLR